MEKERLKILLTNDDGIQSPGIWAAAEVLAEIGELWVVGPQNQCTSAGRSRFIYGDGTIQKKTYQVNGKNMIGYSVNATPAQVVSFAIREVLRFKPDLLVSGINFGANTGYDITCSGTVGAALEGASYGVRSLAVSMETDIEHVFTHSEQVDFSTAAYFAGYFTRRLINAQFGADINVVKVEVPADATPKTNWEVTSLSSARTYLAVQPPRENIEEPFTPIFSIQKDPAAFIPGSDAHTVFVKRKVAVTPLSLNLTSRVDLNQFEQYLQTLG